MNYRGAFQLIRFYLIDLQLLYRGDNHKEFALEFWLWFFNSYQECNLTKHRVGGKQKPHVSAVKYIGSCTLGKNNIALWASSSLCHLYPHSSTVHVGFPKTPVCSFLLSSGVGDVITEEQMWEFIHRTASQPLPPSAHNILPVAATAWAQLNTARWTRIQEVTRITLQRLLP